MTSELGDYISVLTLNLPDVVKTITYMQDSMFFAGNGHFDGIKITQKDDRIWEIIVKVSCGSSYCAFSKFFAKSNCKKFPQTDPRMSEMYYFFTLNLRIISKAGEVFNLPVNVGKSSADSWVIGSHYSAYYYDETNYLQFLVPSPKDNIPAAMFYIKSGGNSSFEFVPISYNFMKGNDNKDWIKTLVEAKPDIKLGDVCIPGTHDSAAINPSTTTPWACQNLTIIGQLNYGIRFLDIRLAPVETDVGGWSFVTCHGSGLSGAEYQSFKSVLDEVDVFLGSENSKSEVVVMSLKIEDWRGNEYRSNEIFRSLKYNALNWHGRVLIKDNPADIALKSVAGRIVILNRMKGSPESGDDGFGPFLDWPDNTDWTEKTVNGMNLYVQDEWSTWGPSFKWAAFRDAMLHSKNAPFIFFNFLSAGQKPFGLFNVDIMPDLIEKIGKMSLSDRPKANTMGIVPMNYCDATVYTDIYGPMSAVQLLISANSGYSQYPATWVVEYKKTLD